MDWTLARIPSQAERYVEPFGGAGVVMLNRPPAQIEVYNDLNGDLVNLYKILRDPAAHLKLRHMVDATLYSQETFGEALESLRESTDPLTRAWAMMVAYNQGFGGRAKSMGDWGRSYKVYRKTNSQTSKWDAKLGGFPEWHRRVRKWIVTRADGLEVIQYWDSPGTVFYLDPPYVTSTRKGVCYEHEMDDEQHRALVRVLLKVQGCVTLAGYPHELYQPLAEAGWITDERRTIAHAAGRTKNSQLQGGPIMDKVARTEVVWLNPKAAERLGYSTRQATMF